MLDRARDMRISLLGGSRWQGKIEKKLVKLIITFLGGAPDSGGVVRPNCILCTNLTLLTIIQGEGGMRIQTMINITSFFLAKCK